MAERHFEERRSTAMEGKGVESAETAAYAAAKNSSDGAGSDSGGSQKSNRPASSEKSETGNRPFNVYVKNFPVETDTQKLEDMFSGFGTIRSCTVLCDHSGKSKQVGFVQFSAEEEATKAVTEMHGREGFGPKLLHVALTNPKPPRSQKRTTSSGSIVPYGAVYPGYPYAMPYQPGVYSYHGWPPSNGMVPLMVFPSPYPPGIYPPQQLRGHGYESSHHAHAEPAMFPHSPPYVMPFVPPHVPGGGPHVPAGARHACMPHHPSFAPGFCHGQPGFPGYPWAPPYAGPFHPGPAAAASKAH